MDREARHGRLGLWRLVVIPAVLVALAVLWPTLHLGAWLTALRAWIASLGPLGPAVYAVVQALMVPLVVPALAMTVGAAALFGPVVGTVVVVVASNIGAALCFLIARYLARDTVVALVSRREEFRRIDRLVAERGALAVALVRLVPVSPFELASYAFGLTGVPFGTYVLWTAIGSLPGAVLYVTGASSVVQAVSTGRLPAGTLLVFSAVLLAVIAIAVRLGRELRA